MIHREAVGQLIVETEYDPATQKLGPVIYEDGIPTGRQKLTIDPAEAAENLEQDRAAMQERVRVTRADAHDRIAKRSVGVATIYRVNLEAAEKYLANNTSPMPDGKTPEQYLAFGARLGMDVPTFAAWIVSENRRLGPGAWDVEDQYLATRITVATSNDPAVWDTAIANYKAFCATIQSE